MATFIRTIVTHVAPHLDEIFALWLLFWRPEGEQKFPGVGKAEIQFRGRGGEYLDGVPPDKLLEQGILALGIGGGMFDEHEGPNSPGKPGKCVADLIAEALGLQDDPGLHKILPFVHATDLATTGHPFDLAVMVKTMHNANPDDPHKVIKWAMEGLEAKYRQQLVFCQAQRASENVRTEEVRTRGGRKLVMMISQTENKEFGKACRTKGAAVIIQQQPAGNIQIFTNKKFDVDLTQVAELLENAEQELGEITYGARWHLGNGPMLLNGSTTHP